MAWPLGPPYITGGLRNSILNFGRVSTFHDSYPKYVGPNFYNVRLLKCFHEDCDSASHLLSDIPGDAILTTLSARLLWIIEYTMCSKPLILYGFSYNFPGFSSTRTYYNQHCPIIVRKNWDCFRVILLHGPRLLLCHPYCESLLWFMIKISWDHIPRSPREPMFCTS